jgi:periplasmic protein TonB
MSLEPQHVRNENLGSLQGCLVGGDPDQRSRERKVRKRALVISVALQTTVLAVVVLIPLFAKPPLLVTSVAPFPIYAVTSNSSHPAARPQVNNRRPCVVCFNSRPANVTPNERIETTQLQDPFGESGPNRPAVLCRTCLDIGQIEGPRAPHVDEAPPEKPRIIRRTEIDPAMLIRRVEPVYPILAKQTRRSGKVELRAIIATDGTIRSLRVVSGDPFFYESARAAVSQWRYRPTVLNGQPVEIDTFISVIYNIDH